MLGIGSRRKEIVTILAAALIAVAAALFFAPLVPAVNNFANTPNATTIPLQACIAPFREGQNIREVFQGTIATNCRTRQGKYGYGTFWAVSQKIDEKITKNWQDQNLALVSQSTSQHSRTIFIEYADGYIYQDHIGSSEEILRIAPGGLYIEPLPLRSAPVVRVGWLVREAVNGRGVVIEPRLVSEDQAEQIIFSNAVMFAAIGGLLVGLIVHHFMLWYAMRFRFQVAYCVILAMVIGYLYSTSGMILTVFSGMENTFRHRLNFTFLAFIQASVIVFARLYFGPEVYKRPQAAFHNLLVGVLVLLALACLVVPAPWSHLIALPYQVCALACVAYFVWIVASALLVGSRFAGLFAIAWTLPVTAGLVRVLQNFEILPWGHWSERTTLTAMALEAIISAAAIIFQIRLIQAERDQARAGELKALELADRDPLTGVLNRRALLRTIVGREQLHQLVLIDVDHFKAVNEQLGHDGGDLVLSSVAAALTEAMPSGGLLARLGGDEFAAIIPVDGADGSRRVLERLSTAAAQAEAPVTFSMGVSTGTIRTEQEWRLLYKSADRALYKAKSEGRSLTRFADPAAVI